MGRYIWIGMVLLLADFVMNVLQAAISISTNIDYSSTTLFALIGYVLAGVYVTYALKGEWTAGLIGGIVYSLFDATLGLWVTDQLMAGRSLYQPPDSSELIPAMLTIPFIGADFGALGGWIAARLLKSSDSDDQVRRK